MKTSNKNIIFSIIIATTVVWWSGAAFIAGKSVEIDIQLNNYSKNDNASMITSGVKGVVYFLGLECPPNITTRTPPCSGPYPNYDVTAYSGNCSTVVGKTKTDSVGQYYLALPPGNYTIFTPSALDPSDMQCNNFVIKEGTLVKDLNVDTGVR